MELMLLVYVVENLTYTGSFTNLFVAASLALLFLFLFIVPPSVDFDFDKVWGFAKKLPYKTYIGFCIFLLVTSTILPTKETAIKMAAAYLLQEVVTHDKTKELGDAAYNAALRQLNQWAEDVPDVAQMLVDEGVLEVEKKVKDKLD